MADPKPRFDPEQVFPINGSWLNAIEDLLNRTSKLEKRMAKAMPMRTAMELFEFQMQFYGARFEQLAKAAGVKLDPYAWDYASAYAETFAAQHYEQGKSEEESIKAADTAGLLAKARAMAANTATQSKPRIARMGTIGETVADRATDRSANA